MGNLSGFRGSVLKKFVFRFVTCFFVSIVTFFECHAVAYDIVGRDYAKYFENNGGCAVFLKDNECYVYGDESTGIRKSPCSTFKIVATLAGLKCGVLKDENTVIKWDGVKRYFDEWNKDLSLKEAFNLSAVWYFEKVANEIGKEKLTDFVNEISYGNKDTSAEIPFWLDSSLTISPMEQTGFLKNLFEYKLSIDGRNIEILKKIMQKESINDGLLYGKTGTSGNGNNGWFVGFYEKNGKKVYFAINLSSGKDISGKHAEKIAKNIIADCF